MASSAERAGLDASKWAWLTQHPVGQHAGSDGAELCDGNVDVHGRGAEAGGTRGAEEEEPSEVELQYGLQSRGGVAGGRGGAEGGRAGRGGREREREGGREGGMEGGMEGGREGREGRGREREGEGSGGERGREGKGSGGEGGREGKRRGGREGEMVVLETLADKQSQY